MTNSEWSKRGLAEYSKYPTFPLCFSNFKLFGGLGETL